MLNSFLDQIINFSIYGPILTNISFNEVLDEEKRFFHILESYWYQHTFLTIKWWFLIILSIFPAIIWWKLVSKKNIMEILSFGLFYGMSSIILDSIGSFMFLWTYPNRITPYLYPQLFPYDVGIIIIPFMLVFDRWGINFKKYFLFSGLLSAFLSFIAEPFLEWLQVYKVFSWKNIYSFCIYWILALICWAILQFLKRKQKEG